jgi:hypothetical protein
MTLLRDSDRQAGHSRGCKQDGEQTSHRGEASAGLEERCHTRSVSAANVRFRGILDAVKPRIGLHRSFDEVWHSYRGYVLVLRDGPRVAVGPGAHEKHAFRAGDLVEGVGIPVPGPHKEWAELYKVRGLRVIRRGPAQENRPADIDGGIAPALEDYRSRGHRRLDPRTYERSCSTCPFGAVMPTEVIVDHWNPKQTTKWRVETHCYGPHDCPRYRAGRPRSVPGREPGTVFIDET